MGNYRIARLTHEERSDAQSALAELEATSSYPLGSDRFSIDHGADYFAFFDRLGDARTYVVRQGSALVATGTGVLRDLPAANGARREAWYICDIKVHPDHRRRGLALRLLAHAFPREVVRCGRGYGIAMMTADGAEPPSSALAARFGPLAGVGRTKLRLCSLSAGDMERAEPVLRRHRGQVGYLSHAGRKDIVLASTGRPMRLLHAQFGPCADIAIHAPQPGAVHMFCAPETDPIWTDLSALKIAPDAAALILHYRMEGTDWRFVLTSDI